MFNRNALPTTRPQPATMRGQSLSAITLLGLALVCACSSTHSESTQSPGPASRAVADPQRSDGTTFDPCVAFTASDLTKWGVKPTAEAHAGAPNEAARGCQWRSLPCPASAAQPCWSGVVNVLVSNKTLADYVRDFGAHDHPVAGRPGVMSTSGSDTCYVSTPAQTATVTIGVTYDHPVVGDPCATASNIAVAVANYLPPAPR
jgi:hypothetical protein